MNSKKSISNEYIVNVEKRTYKKLIRCYQCVFYRSQKNYNEWDICSYFDKATLEYDYCSRGKEKEL